MKYPIRIKPPHTISIILNVLSSIILLVITGLINYDRNIVIVQISSILINTISILTAHKIEPIKINDNNENTNIDPFYIPQLTNINDLPPATIYNLPETIIQTQTSEK